MNLGNSLGWWAANVATYCPSRPSQLTEKNITKYVEQVDENRCRFIQLKEIIFKMWILLLLS